MQTVAFGRTGCRVAPLGIGSLAVGPTEAEQDRVVRLMERLLDAGCTLVDTAQCYPRSEDLIGRRLRHRRGDMVLVTKCGHHDVLPDGSMRSRPVSMDDVDGALRRLRTDVLDAMLLHSYDLDLLERGEALDVLDRARRAGKVRFVGYSGDNERAAFAARHPAVDVLEVSVNLCDWHNVRTVLPTARERNLAVIAKRPLANAAWRFLDEPGWAGEPVRPYAERLRAMDVAPEAFGCASWGELALRATLSVPGVHCAIPSSATEAHQDENLRVAADPPLPAADVGRLRAAFDDAEARAGATWDSLN